MNRKERRQLERQGIKVPKDPSINIKLSELGGKMMSPNQKLAMDHEINQQCIEAYDRLALDVDTATLWALHQYLGWGKKRLHDFYIFMFAEHKRMREFYEMDDLYPERFKLKELGADIEQWEKEAMANVT